MPDDAACNNSTCVVRYLCARYRMAYGDWQSVATLEAKGCRHFLHVAMARWSLVSVHESDERWLQETDDA